MQASRQWIMSIAAGIIIVGFTTITGVVYSDQEATQKEVTATKTDIAVIKTNIEHIKEDLGELKTLIKQRCAQR